MAQTLVMLTGGIDLTVGAMVSLGSVLSATLVADDRRRRCTVGIVAVLAVGAVIGALIGAAVACPAPAGDHRHACLLVHRRRRWLCW